MKILVVEDEPLLREGLLDLLSGAGHQVKAVGDGLMAVSKGSTEPFDMVVLDLMLPKMDGLEVCEHLRQIRPGLPILMLTAMGSEEDKVRGLRSGADDYVVKPFGAKELLARLDSLARRVRYVPAEPERIEWKGCKIDLGRCEVDRDGEKQSLTPREAGIIRWLFRHRDRAVSRHELLEHIWGIAGKIETRTVDMTIANLRQKIEPDPTQPQIIVSVKGSGYVWGKG